MSKTQRPSALHLIKAKPGPSFSRIRQAVRLWRNGYGSKEQRKRNMRAWLLAVEALGKKWVYAELQPLVRKN